MGWVMGVGMAKWVQEAIGELAVCRRAFMEFLELMRETGFRDEEIYQLCLVWLEPLGPKED